MKGYNRKSVGRYVSCIHRYSRIYIANELEALGIGYGQFHFLRLLYKKDGINQETLAEFLMTDKATSARAIKKLEDEGYIIREKDKFDKRSYKIFLTEKAKKFEPKIKKILRNWTEILLTDFNEDEKKLLFKYLQRIVDNATSEKTKE